MNVSLSTLSSSTKVVCNKEDVVLLKDGNEEIKNKYRIIFNAHNSNFPIKAIVGLKLYALLYELNRDIIHTFKIIKEDDSAIETLFLFKPFGKDFGISPRCMHMISTSTMSYDTDGSGSNAYIFDSVDVVVDAGIINIPKKYERIQTTHSKLIVYLISEYDLQFDFTFHLNEDDSSNESPIYMENSIALMIKKMFCRLKVFTERMT